MSSSSRYLLSFNHLVFYRSFFFLYSCNSFLLSFFLRAGDVFCFYYIIKSQKLISSRFIVGMCLSIRIKQNQIFALLRNTYKKDRLEFTFCCTSPFILNLELLSKYQIRCRLSRLYYIRLDSSKLRRKTFFKS